MTLWVNGKPLSQDEYSVHPHLYVPIHRPWWKRWLSRWIPSFREQFRDAGPYVIFKEPAAAGASIVMLYEIPGKEH